MLRERERQREIYLLVNIPEPTVINIFKSLFYQDVHPRDSALFFSVFLQTSPGSKLLLQLSVKNKNKNNWDLRVVRTFWN